MQADGVGESGLAVEVEDALAVLELALEVFVGLVFQFRGYQLLPVVVPVGINADEDVRFVPVDGVAHDEALAGAGGVHPEADEAVFPDGGGGVVGPGDEACVGGADGLPGEGFADPDFAFAGIEDADVRVFAVEFSVHNRLLTRGPGGSSLFFKPNIA